MTFLGLIATVDFSRPAVNGSTIVYRCVAPAGTNQESPAFRLRVWPFEIELCASRDYVPYRVVVSRCRAFELTTGFVDPKAHRNPLTGPRYFCPISPRGEDLASTFLIVVSDMVISSRA